MSADEDGGYLKGGWPHVVGGGVLEHGYRLQVVVMACWLAKLCVATESPALT